MNVLVCPVPHPQHQQRNVHMLTLFTGNMTRVYYKYAIAAIIGMRTQKKEKMWRVEYVRLTDCVVFDVSRPATFEAITKV